MTRHARARQRLSVAIATVGLLVVAAAVWFQYRQVSPQDIARDAVVNASSVSQAASLPALVSGGRVDDPNRGWFTKNQTVGAWIKLQWPELHTLRRIVLQRDSLDKPGIQAGYLTFGDGSELQLTLSTTSRTTVIPISPRRVDQFQFTVSAVAKGARSVGLTNVSVYDQSQAGDVVASHGSGSGDVAGAASVSSSLATGAGSLQGLVDGGREGGSGLGQTWQTAEPVGAWVRLNWARPRELNTISVAGAQGSSELQVGTLVFSDGSRLTLGAVLPDPSRPTVLSFMPRVTSSIQLIFDSVSGHGPLALSEISADEASARPDVPIPGQQPAPAPTTSCGQPVPRPKDTVGIVLQCPTNGSYIGDNATLDVSAGPSYKTVAVTVLPGDGGQPARPTSTVAVSPDGSATVDLDVRTLPAGPFSVRLDAAAAGKPTRQMLVQLDKTGTAPAARAAAPSIPARGRSLVYADEFTQPLSISRTGADASYAAGKPNTVGVEDFGAAIFADPAANLGNFRMVNDQYLGIAVQPRPADFADPGDFGRQYVSGLLSSARPGGSGFSAQYGYFEARMLAPVAPGTWPAFWMLPNPNLVVSEKVVAEIDAVELYGQVPTGSCESTHQYSGGKDGGVARCSSSRWKSINDAARWHTYGVSIGPNEITYFIDNQLVATAPQVHGGSDPMFFLVDLALGGGWPVDLASLRGHTNLYVDYIRVYV